MEKYVLRNGKYPDDAVEVVSREGDIVKFASMGGGFVKVTKAVDFDKNFRPFRDDLDTLTWKQAEVVIEDWPSVSGYVQGTRWNGWVMPCFTKEDIQAANSASRR